MSKLKILCTGSAGFIFSNFIRLATRDTSDYVFVSVDKIATTHSLHNIYINRDHKFYIGDVADKHFINILFELERPDIVIQGAAESNVDDSISSASPFIMSNVLGTQVIIDACVKYKVSKLIFISTDEIYGQLTSAQDKSWTEDCPMSPRNPYAASKGAGELLVKAAHETHGLQYNITRSCNNYGPRQSAKNLIPKTIRNVLNKDKIPLYGKGDQIREWIHVGDNCKAILKIIEKGAPNEIYNISAGYELSNLELVQNICNIMESGHDLISFIPDPRPGHDFRYSIDATKLKTLGWAPEFKFKKGLNLAIQWYCNNKWFLR
jgi:dTDP-glucose 4,6-dehydratase